MRDTPSGRDWNMTAWKHKNKIPGPASPAKHRLFGPSSVSIMSDVPMNVTIWRLRGPSSHHRSIMRAFISSSPQQDRVASGLSASETHCLLGEAVQKVVWEFRGYGNCGDANLDIDGLLHQPSRPRKTK
ncbi:hypothetical protein J7T55_002443 [Diaporthe amygdali]|uniref:uncharacterized protein n=1 Tax=Phomopsis amygdali TaxID=1214568 RepID=UPI0022FEBEE8|nr:uncharacterized protein J7T55_002443 [Diaporthe amygdali]KAJ0121933.1 hypothetical protein J7T55_002443 [Diaporthe amygdali]